MAERRKAVRNRTLKAGRIRINARMSTIECTIRNLSEKGALLLVHTMAVLPPEFELQFESDKSKRPCRVIWRGINRVGVEFA